MKCIMGCLRGRDIFYIIVNSSLLLLGHTHFKSGSRLRSWQRSWLKPMAVSSWNSVGPDFHLWYFPLNMSFFVLLFQSVVFLFVLKKTPTKQKKKPPNPQTSVALKMLWKLTFFEQYATNLLLSMRKCGEILLHWQADKVELWSVSILMLFQIFLLSSQNIFSFEWNGTSEKNMPMKIRSLTGRGNSGNEMAGVSTYKARAHRNVEGGRTQQFLKRNAF